MILNADHLTPRDWVQYHVTEGFSVMLVCNACGNSRTLASVRNYRVPWFIGCLKCGEQDRLEFRALRPNDISVAEKTKSK